MPENKPNDEKESSGLPDWVRIGKKVNFKNPSSRKIESGWEVTSEHTNEGPNKNEDWVVIKKLIAQPDGSTQVRKWPVKVTDLEKFNLPQKEVDSWVQDNLKTQTELSAFDPATKQIEPDWKIAKTYEDDPEHVTLERTVVVDDKETVKQKTFRVEDLKAQNEMRKKEPELEDVKKEQTPKTLFDLELTEKQKAEMQKKLEEILDGSYIKSQEQLRARERYGKTKFISWLREYIGGERIQVKEADVGLEISEGKNRRWWNPVIKLVIGGGAAASTIIASPAMAIGLGAVGASYLARGAVELGKLVIEKRCGIRQSIETSYISKYKQMLALAKETKEQGLEDDIAFAQAFEKLQDFIAEADVQAIGKQLNAEARDDIKNLSITELEAKQAKFEKKWKIAESLVGLGASIGTGFALNEQLIANLLEGKRAALEELLNQKFQFDFDGDGVAHWLQKTKDGWVFLYNSTGEPAELAKHLGTTQWLDKLNILQHGEYGAHIPGVEVASKMEAMLQAKVNLIESASTAQLAEAGKWLSSVVGALGIQSAYDISSAIIGEKRNQLSAKNRHDIEQAQKILTELTTSETKKVPSQEELDEIVKEAEQVIKNKQKSEPKKNIEPTETNELDEQINTEIKRLNEKFSKTEHAINLNLIDNKMNPSIQLEGKSFPILFNPAALIVLRRSQNKEMNLKIEIRNFVKIGNFIGVKVVAPSLSLAKEAPKDLTPQEILTDLQRFVGKKSEANARTAHIGGKEYTSFVFPFMKNLLYRVEFSNPADFGRAKSEIVKKGQANLEIKTINLSYDPQTGEPFYIVKV